MISHIPQAWVDAFTITSVLMLFAFTLGILKNHALGAAFILKGYAIVGGFVLLTVGVQAYKNTDFYYLFHPVQARMHQAVLDSAQAANTTMIDFAETGRSKSGVMHISGEPKDELIYRTIDDGGGYQIRVSSTATGPTRNNVTYDSITGLWYVSGTYTTLLNAPGEQNLQTNSQ